MNQFEEKIQGIHKELNIPADYAQSRGLSMQTETQDLVYVGNDIYGRAQVLERQTADRLKAMLQTATRDGIVLLLVSGYRSVEYQANLIKGKLDVGLSISGVLAEIAAPGYSEHHTGRAMDFASDECDTLTERFETTQAFSWLAQNAKAFDFSLSFPRGNPYGFIYEPWHWACIER